MVKAKPVSDLPRTVEEFDRWHARQPERWELINGTLVMMAQGSLAHTVVKTNTTRHLGNRLAGSGCRVFVDGAEVKERSLNLSAVPDVVVACGPFDFSTPEVREPVVLVEVLSPSSERDDTGRKWQGYCLIPSVRHYLIVDQEKPFITVHTRTGPSSFAEEVIREGTVELTALNVSLILDEIYEDVTFPEPEPSDV
jgi:Uma2 family endonuclease